MDYIHTPIHLIVMRNFKSQLTLSEKLLWVELNPTPQLKKFGSLG